MTLYGSPGCGSAVVEVVLQLANWLNEYVETSCWDQHAHFAALTAQHPVVAKVWEKNFGK